MSDPMDVAKGEVLRLLEDWSARVPGRNEERAALCSVRAVNRMAEKIHGFYESALRATAEAARRDAIKAALRAINSVGQVYLKDHSRASKIFDAVEALFGTPSPTDLAALKEAVADAVMEQRDEDFCTASWWLTKTKIEKACAALAAAQQKESAK